MSGVVVIRPFRFLRNIHVGEVRNVRNTVFRQEITKFCISFAPFKPSPTRSAGFRRAARSRILFASGTLSETEPSSLEERSSEELSEAELVSSVPSSEEEPTIEEAIEEASKEEASEIEPSAEETGGISEEDSLTDEDGASPWEHPARKRDEASNSRIFFFIIVTF